MIHAPLHFWRKATIKVVLIGLLITICIFPSYGQSSPCDGIDNTFYQTVSESIDYINPSNDKKIGEFVGIQIYRYDLIGGTNKPNDNDHFKPIAHLVFHGDLYNTNRFGQQSNGAQSSAYSYNTQRLYINANPTIKTKNSNDAIKNENILTFAVYNPCETEFWHKNFRYVGFVRFPVYNNVELSGIDNLFTTDDAKIGFVHKKMIYMASLQNSTPIKTNVFNNLPFLEALPNQPVAITNPNELEGDSRDWAYYKDHIYSLENRNKTSVKLIKVNIHTGVLTSKIIFIYDKQNNPSDFTKHNITGWGAVWIEGNGNFFAGNNTNHIYYIPNAAEHTSDPSDRIYLAFKKRYSSINDGFGTPNLTPQLSYTNPTCTENGKIRITNYEAGGLYIFEPSTVGQIIQINAQGYVEGLSPNVTYRVRRDFGTFLTSWTDYFSIESKADVPQSFTLSVSSACSPATTGTITTNTSEINVLYQLYNSANVMIGSAISGTGDKLSWNAVPEGTNYYVVATRKTTFDDGEEVSCTAQSSIDVIISPTPTPDAQIKEIPTCSNPGGIIEILNYNASWIYKLYKDGSQYGTFKSAIPGFDNLGSGTYTLTATSTSNCTGTYSGSFTFDPIVDLVPTPTANHTNIDCFNTKGSITVTSTPPIESFEYVLLDALGNEVTRSIEPYVTFPDLDEGLYSIKTIVGACESLKHERTIITIPQPEVFATTIDIDCDNSNLGSITVTAPLGNYEYALKLIGSMDPPTVQSTTVFSGLVEADYELTVKDLDNNCVSDVKLFSILDLTSPPSKPDVTINHPNCINSDYGSIDIDIITGLYKYQIKNKTSGSVPTESDNTTINWLVPGRYEITRINIATKCVSEPTEFEIFDKPVLPTPLYHKLDVQNCSNEASGRIEVSPITPGTSYNLVKVRLDATDETYNETNETGIFDGLKRGKYFLTATNLTTKCESIEEEINILPFINQPAITDVTPIQPGCESRGSITINTVAPLYSFDNGQTYSTNNTLINLAPGKYFLRIKNNFDCASDPYEVIINSQPEVPTIPTIIYNQPSCSSRTGTITFNIVNATDEYSIDNGLSFHKNNIFSDLSPANYTVRVRNLEGCISDSINATIVAPLCPEVSIEKSGVFNDENGNGIADEGETITYKFHITNTGNTPLTDIEISDALAGILIFDSPGSLSLLAGEDNHTHYSATYTIGKNDIIRRQVTNTVNVTAESSRGTVHGSSTVVVPLNPGTLCDIEVFNLVNIKEIGNHAFLEIKGIECYPKNTVEIYNRWGVLVFERQGYDNKNNVFKGFSEGRVTVKSDEKLPSGTYFYLLKYNDERNIYQRKEGYIYLNR